MNEHQNPLKQVRQSVRAIITKKNQGEVSTILMRRTKPSRIYYVTIGGGMESGESEEDALVREIYEEAGISIEIIKKLDKRVNEYENSLEYTHLYHAMYLTGSIGPVGGPEQQRISNDNQYEVVEVTMAEIKMLNIVPEKVKEWLFNIFLQQ